MYKKRVMIVDDDKVFLDELKEALSMSGYDLIAYDNPLSALESADKTKADVVMLDMQMPGTSGLELASQLSYYPRFRGVPIFMMTGHDFRDEEMLIRRYGIRKCLRKPLSLKEVIAEIENVSVRNKVSSKTIHRD
jgi:two-component system CheB/CheR fusion protein